jgi:hypothetical protein
MATGKNAEKGERVVRAPLVRHVLQTSGLVVAGGQRLARAPIVRYEGGKEESSHDRKREKSTREPKRD